MTTQRPSLVDGGFSYIIKKIQMGFRVELLFALPEGKI